MSKYGWNIEGLEKTAQTLLEELEITPDGDRRYELWGLYQEYARLIDIAKFSSDNKSIVKVSNHAWLKSIREEEPADDYDENTKNIRSEILKSFNQFEIMPSPTYMLTFDREYIIRLLGDIIHEIFGDDNYRVYKERIISSPEMIQFSKGEGSSLTSLFLKGDKLDIYTSVTDVRNIEFISDLAHEAGHGYRFVANEYLVYPENKLKEFESFSYQIRVLDYMIKNNLHGKEALKAMIKLINRIETLIHMLKNMDLQYSKNMQHLTFMAHSRNLYSNAHLPNNRQLLLYLDYVKCEYVLPYIYSALAVFDTLESDISLSRYREVINRIGMVDEDEIASSIVDNWIDFNNLSNYKKYREKILGLYNGGKGEK